MSYDDTMEGTNERHLGGSWNIVISVRSENACTRLKIIYYLLGWYFIHDLEFLLSNFEFWTKFLIVSSEFSQFYVMVERGSENNYPVILIIGIEFDMKLLAATLSHCRFVRLNDIVVGVIVVRDHWILYTRIYGTKTQLKHWTFGAISIETLEASWSWPLYIWSQLCGMWEL